MPNITVSITEGLKQNMEKVPELNWSELVRQFLAERIKRELLLKKLDKMLEHSELTDEDCLRLGREAKAGMWKKYKAKGW